MNRQLIIAAALAATGIAHAQSSVSIYGIVDSGLRLDRTAAGTLKSITGGGATGSRWGLRGAEDLGGVLKALLKLVQGFDASDGSNNQGTTSAGAGRTFGRESWVGLSGGFGTLKLGRYYTPYFATWALADPFNNGTVAHAARPNKQSA